MNVKENDIFINTIMYDITMNCNLRCKHCYNSDYLESGQYVEIDIDKIIHGFSKIKFENIVIQGGEPLLIKNLEELIAQFTLMNVNVFITTNAILLNKERIVSLIKSGMRGIFFSVESASEKINDEIRGKGTYKCLYNNVKNFMGIYTALIERKLIHPIRPTISCTASSINFYSDESIRDMFNFAVDLGINDIAFNFLVPYGNSKTLKFNEHISDFRLANSITKISKEYQQISIRLPVKLIEYEYLKKYYGSNINIYGAKEKCPAGDKIAYVDPDLMIYPCIWLPHFVKDTQLMLENTVCLHDEVSNSVFESFLKCKERCITVFQECGGCKYKNKCIPICPCLENSIEYNDSIGKSCPARKEISEYQL